MNAKAVWIIDEAFLTPALVSVRSFLDVVDMPVEIVYCGESETIDEQKNGESKIETEKQKMYLSSSLEQTENNDTENPSGDGDLEGTNSSSRDSSDSAIPHGPGAFREARVTI